MRVKDCQLLSRQSLRHCALALGLCLIPLHQCLAETIYINPKLVKIDYSEYLVAGHVVLRDFKDKPLAVWGRPLTIFSRDLESIHAQKRILSPEEARHLARSIDTDITKARQANRWLVLSDVDELGLRSSGPYKISLSEVPTDVRNVADYLAVVRSRKSLRWELSELPGLSQSKILAEEMKIFEEPLLSDNDVAKLKKSLDSLSKKVEALKPIANSGKYFASRFEQEWADNREAFRLANQVARCDRENTDSLHYDIQVLTAVIQERSRQLSILCALPAPGQSKFVGKTGPGIGRGHRLRRSSDDPNLFMVELNLSFQARTAVGTYDPNGKNLVDKIQKRLDECLPKINERLRGPDGRRIMIQLYRPGKEGDRIPPPPKAEIDVYPHDFRYSSSQWGHGIECPTMAHELLHILGLSDLYKEKTLGYTVDQSGNVTGDLHEGASGVIAYDCRVIGPIDSVMSSQWIAWSGSTRSLIYPGEFDAILRSEDCLREAGHNYWRCTRGAYQTSVISRCPPVPAVCREGGTWLMQSLPY